MIKKELSGFLIRIGIDLLSHSLNCSTIGAKAFHGRVRDGAGWFNLAMDTECIRSSELGRIHSRS